MVSLLSLNMLTNNSSTMLIKKEANNTLNKIYEKGIVETISSPDTIISSEATSNVVTISNKVMQSGNVVSTSSYVKPSYNSLTGSNLVNYAKNFVGLRYVSAGTSLATGTDCSGFTSLIYKEFGITLGRTVSSQLYSGTYVNREELEPGDLIFYSYGSVASHVAIYIGNGMIIHESNPRDGVKISTMNIMRYITARRIITANVGSSSVEESIVSESINTNSESTLEAVDNNQVKDNNKEVVVEEVKSDENLVVDNKVNETETVSVEETATETKTDKDNEPILETKEEVKTVEPIIEETTIVEDNNNSN